MKDKIAIILAITISIAILLPIIGAIVYGHELGEQTVDWLGNIIMAIVGGLLLYLGIKNNNNRN